VTAVGLLLFVDEYLRNRGSRKSAETRLEMFGLVVLCSALVVLIYYGEKLNLEALNPIACLGLAYACLYIRRRHVRLALYFVLGLVCLVAFQKDDIDNSIIIVGQNGMMLHVQTLYVVYYFVVHNRKTENISKWTFFENYFVVSLMFTLSVWSQSRAATLVSLLLLFGAAVIWMKELQGRGQLLVFVFTIFIVWMNYYAPILMADRPYSAIDRIGFAGISDIRYAVWIDYFQTLEPVGVLLGNRNSNCHQILEGYSQGWCNVHNSYLRAHQVYGFVGSSTILVVCWFSLLGLWNKGRKFASFVFLLILLRAATDEHFFVQSNLFIVGFVYFESMKSIKRQLGEGG